MSLSSFAFTAADPSVEREALRWVQKYGAAFGGDVTKVTIWGEFFL